MENNINPRITPTSKMPKIDILSLFNEDEKSNILITLESLTDNLFTIVEIGKHLKYYIDYYYKHTDDPSSYNTSLIINSFIENIFVFFGYFLDCNKDVISLYNLLTEIEKTKII